MIIHKIIIDKMIIYKMIINKMIIYKMIINKMIINKNDNISHYSFYIHFTNNYFINNLIDLHFIM